MTSIEQQARIPRGYHDPEKAPPEQALWRAPLFFSAACWLGLLASWHEVAVRQVFAYQPGPGPLAGWQLTCVGAASALLGAFVARRVRGSLSSWFSFALLLSSALVGASAPLCFVTFTNPHALFVRLLVLATCCFALGFGFGLSLRRLAPLWRQLGLFGHALDPWFVLSGMVALGVAMGVAPAIGLLRTASVAAMLLAVWASWHLVLDRFVERRPLPHARRLQALCFSVFVAHALVFALSERWVSLKDLGYFHSTIVYTDKSDRSELVVTSGSGGLQLFVDRSLKLSDHDENRYYESLVQPALLVARRHQRAAVLGVADGMAARQLLVHPAVERIDLVTLDAGIASVARTTPWLVALNGGSLSSERVRLVEQDPYLWLEGATSRYDIVIVDLLDPTNYQRGKYYTTHFYRRLAQRLRPSGVIAVQATSVFASPRTFANLNATLRAAGLETLGYRAAVPSLGDWGFILASREPLSAPVGLDSDLGFLSATALTAMFHLPADIQLVPDRPSKLYDQRAVHLLREERSRRR